MPSVDWNTSFVYICRSTVSTLRMIFRNRIQGTGHGEREKGGGLNLKMKVILHSILLCFFCLFIGPSLFSFKLIFRLDLAGFYHSRANNKTSRILFSFKSFMRAFVPSLRELKEIVLKNMLIWTCLFSPQHLKQFLQISMSLVDMVQQHRAASTQVRIMTDKLHCLAVFNNGLCRTLGWWLQNRSSRSSRRIR